jgi:hypothetical protein
VLRIIRRIAETRQGRAQLYRGLALGSISQAALSGAAKSRYRTPNALSGNLRRFTIFAFWDNSTTATG